MGDPNLWGRGGQDTKAINKALGDIQSAAYAQARAAGAAEPYRIPAPGATPATASPSAAPTSYNIPAPQAGLQLPKLPEFRYDLPQIQDLSKLMQQSPIPGVGGLGKALEQAAAPTEQQWNPAGIRDVPVLSAIPRGAELAMNMLNAYQPEMEPLRGGLFGPLTPKPYTTVGQLGETTGKVGRGEMNPAEATLKLVLGPQSPLLPVQAAWKTLALPENLEKTGLMQVSRDFQKRAQAGVPLSDNLGQALGEQRTVAQKMYDALPPEEKLMADVIVDPLNFVPGAGVGKAQKAKLVGEAMRPIEGGLKTTEELMHANTGLGRFLPWDKTSRLHETVKTAFQSIADSTVNAPDFASALNNIARWGSAGTEAGFDALKAYLGKPNLGLYEQRAARLLAGFPERTRAIEKAYNAIGRDATALTAIDLKKVPAGPLREVVKTIQTKGINDAAEIGRLIDEAARDHLAADAVGYMAGEGQKVLKIPPPNVGQRFLDNVLRPLEAIAYIGLNPVSLLRNWGNNKATLVLEGVSPLMKLDARIARLEASGVKGVAAELRKAERAYQAMAQVELSVAKAAGRTGYSGTGLMGQMGGLLGKIGKDYTLLGLYGKLEEADRKIAWLHGFEKGLQNWQVATKGKGWIPQMPAAVLAHLTPDDAKRIYAVVRDAGPNPKALREMVSALFDGVGAPLDYERLAAGLSERLSQLSGQAVTLDADAVRAILASGGHEQALQEAAANITRRVRAGEAFDAVRDDELSKLAAAVSGRFKRVTPEAEAFAKQISKYDFSVLSDKALEREWNSLLSRSQKGLKLTPAQDARMAALRAERAKRGLPGATPTGGLPGATSGPTAPRVPPGAPSPRGPKPKGFPSQVRKEEYQLTAQGFDPMQVAEIMNSPRLRRWWRSRNDTVDTLKARNVPRQELDAAIAKYERRNPMPKGLTPEPQMPIEAPEKAVPPVAATANKFGYADTPHTRIFGLSDRGGSVLGDAVHNQRERALAELERELGSKERAERFYQLFRKGDAETAEREFAEFAGKGAETRAARKQAATTSIRWKEAAPAKGVAPVAVKAPAPAAPTLPPRRQVGELESAISEGTQRLKYGKNAAGQPLSTGERARIQDYIDNAKAQIRELKGAGEQRPLPTKPVAAKAAEAKEPWQMTQKKYIEDFHTKKYIGNRSFGEIQNYKQTHRLYVKQALEEGKPVPPEVLRDYPDLAKAAPKSAETEAALQARYRKAAEEDAALLAAGNPKAPGYTRAQFHQELDALKTQGITGDEIELIKRLWDARADQAVASGLAKTPDEYLAQKLTRVEAGAKYVVTGKINEGTALEQTGALYIGDDLKKAKRIAATQGGVVETGETAREYAKGATNFLVDDGRAILHAFQGADVSTLAHESAHIWFADLGRADLDTIGKWAGMGGDDVGARLAKLHDGYVKEALTDAEVEEYVRVQEQFANGFERYLRTGEAPTPRLQAIFDRFKEWLTSIYREIKGTSIDVQVSPEVKGVFDRMLAGEEIAGLKSEFARQGAREYLQAQRGTGQLWARQMDQFFTKSGETPKVWFNQVTGDWRPVGDSFGGKEILGKTPTRALPDKSGEWKLVPGDDVPGWRDKVLESFKQIMPEGLLGDAADADQFEQLKRVVQQEREAIKSGLYQKGPKPRQEEMFTQGEDLPLFSGTAQKANVAPFKPAEVGAQTRLPGVSTAPEVKGAKAGGEVAGEFMGAGAKRPTKKAREPLPKIKLTDEQMGQTRIQMFESRKEAVKWVTQNQNGIAATKILEMPDGRTTVQYLPKTLPQPSLFQKAPDLDEDLSFLRDLPVDEASARALGADAQQQGEAQLMGHVLELAREMWQRQAPALQGTERRNAVMRYLEEQVIPLANDARTAAMKMGDWWENATVLNYNGRNFVDNASSLYMPFGFFRFHYGQETLRRMVDRPALVSLYSHLADSLDSVQDDPAFPQRLKGKTFVSLPFLPAWMGGGAFFDPLEQLVPVKQVFGLNQFQTGGQVEDADIAQSVRALAVRGEVSQSEAANAIAKKEQSELWRQTRARLEQMTQESQGLNSFSDLFQAHAPVDIAWKVLTGRPQDVGVLFPATRLVKGASSPFVPGGINIEQPLKQGLRRMTGEPSIPDYDAFEQYRVDRAIADMVGEGKLDARAALIALMEHSGKDYETAKQRAGETSGVSALSAVAAQVFPEGERAYYKARLGRDQLLSQEIQRSGADPARMTTDQKWEFVTAHKLFAQGSALSRYYEQHPELGVKSAVFNENEGRLKNFIVSDLWDAYNKLGKLDKSVLGKQMPPEFKANFLDKEGRGVTSKAGSDYANVTLEDLVTWAKALKLYVPKAAGVNVQARTAPDLRFAPAEQSRKYEQFRTYVASVFNMNRLQPQLDGYYALPAAAKGLSAERRQYRANHPEVERYLQMYSQFLNANPDVAFVLNPEGQRYYSTQATQGQTVTQLQKMVRQISRGR